MNLRHNAHTQAIADREASEHWDYAIYIGHYQQYLVYLPVYSDSIVRVEGLPQYILIDEHDNVLWSEVGSPFDSFEIYDYCSRHYDSHRPGRKLLREYRRKVMENDFLPTDDKKYISEIVHITRFPGEVYYGYDTPVEFATMCDYLYIAHRTGKRLRIVSDDSINHDRLDGWEYYLEIVD